MRDSKYPPSVKAGKPVLDNLPAGWCRNTLDKYLELVPRKVKLENDKEYDLLTVKRSRGGVVRREHLLGSQILVKSQFEVKEGDFVISKRQIVHGACGLVPKHLDGSIVSNEYAVFHSKPNFALSYLQYLSETLYFQQTCFHSSIGLHIEKMIFKLEEWFKWPFNIPPLPEQQKIAKILSTWDKAISTTEQLITQSQQQKKALMQQLLTGKKRLLDNNGQPFKGDWPSVHFKDILKVIGGNAFKSEEFKLSGLPIVRISNIKPSYSICLKSAVYVAEQKKFGKFLITKGDVLIAMSGATTGKVGQYKLSTLAYLNQRVGKFKIRDNKASENYIFQLLRLSKIQHSILIDATGGAQPNISNKDIERIKINLPPLPEQQKIAAVLTAADKEIELLNQKLKHLKQEKKALMQQLLTGKRRVQIDHKESA